MSDEKSFQYVKIMLSLFRAVVKYFIFIFKERFTEIFVELNLGLCDILESSSVFSSTYPMIVIK